MNAARKQLGKHVGVTPDFPKPGIIFRDFCPLLENPRLREMLLREMRRSIKDELGPANICAGLDSRGLWLAAALVENEQHFVPVRKAGKLPPPKKSQKYQLEYGSATFEVSAAAAKPGDRVLLIDDLLATGGSLIAATMLFRELKAEVVGALTVIELADLGGRARLNNAGIKVASILQF